MRGFLTGSGSPAVWMYPWTSSPRMEHETCVTQCDSININRMSIQKHLCHDTKHILHFELLWVCVCGFLSHRHLSENRLLDIPSWARSHGLLQTSLPKSVSAAPAKCLDLNSLVSAASTSIYVSQAIVLILIGWPQHSCQRTRDLLKFRKRSGNA